MRRAAVSVDGAILNQGIKSFMCDSWLFLPRARLAACISAEAATVCDIVRMEQLEMADAAPDASCPSLHSAGRVRWSSTPPSILPSHPLSFHPYI